MVSRILHSPVLAGGLQPLVCVCIQWSLARGEGSSAKVLLDTAWFPFLPPA